MSSLGLLSRIMSGYYNIIITLEVYSLRVQLQVSDRREEPNCPRGLAGMPTFPIYLSLGRDARDHGRGCPWDPDSGSGTEYVALALLNTDNSAPVHRGQGMYGRWGIIPWRSLDRPLPSSRKKLRPDLNDR